MEAGIAVKSTSPCDRLRRRGEVGSCTRLRLGRSGATGRLPGEAGFRALSIEPRGGLAVLPLSGYAPPAAITLRGKIGLDGPQQLDDIHRLRDVSVAPAFQHSLSVSAHRERCH